LNSASPMINSNLINVSSVAPATLALNTTTMSPTAAAMLAAQIAGQTTARRAMDAGWISDTELTTGEIPAIVDTDAALDIKPAVTAVVDMHVNNTNAAAGKTVALNKGSVVFAPAVDTTVQTPFGEIKIAAHSLVLVLSFSGGVAVYNLDDMRKDAVSIHTGNHVLPMTPGTAIVLSSTRAHSFDEINPAQLFLYRNMTEQQLGGSIKAFVGEFMPQSAIRAVMPLRKLVNSKQPDARRMGDHLLKTAAIVVQTRAGKGQYKQILRPSMAAWAP
jgi:hypothetical protein